MTIHRLPFHLVATLLAMGCTDEPVAPAEPEPAPLDPPRPVLGQELVKAENTLTPEQVAKRDAWYTEAYSKRGVPEVYDDITRPEDNTPERQAKIEAWFAEVSTREAKRAECAHKFDGSRCCMVCGVELAIELDILDDKYLGDPGTFRYVGVVNTLADRTERPAPPPPRAAGLQIRDAREAVHLGLRGLASRVSLSAVELGNLERGVDQPTHAIWSRLCAVLPGLGDMPPPSPPPKPGLPDAIVQAAHHPTGRCTCGGERRCAWCEMDRRREIREARAERRRGPTPAARAELEAAGAETDDPELVSDVEKNLRMFAADERARKREAHQRKQARRRKTGRR